MDLSKDYEKITYKILIMTNFSDFLQNFGKCRFGEVSFQQSGFRQSVTDPFNKFSKTICICSD